MKTKILWSLAVLNVVLLAMFIMRQTRDNAAMAQRTGAVGAVGGAARSGDYVLVPGEVTGSEPLRRVVELGLGRLHDRRVVRRLREVDHHDHW